MLLSSAGAAGQIVLLVAAVGLPVQFALAALITLGRRIGGTAATFVPTVCLAAGLVGLSFAVDDAIAAVGGSADPAWIPWFAVQDRGRACASGALGASAALLLVLPPAIAASVAAIRSGRVRWWAAGVGIAGSLLAAAGMIGAAVVAGDPGAALLPAGTILLLGGPAAVAAAEASAPGRRAPPLVAPRVAAASFLVGSVAVLVAATCLAWLGVAAALPDFEHPFARVGAIQAAAQGARMTPWVTAPFLLLAGVGLLPALFLRRVRALDASVGMDALSVLGQALCLGLLAGWVALRWGALSHLAGEHNAAVLDDRGQLDVPRVAPVPARVLVLEPGQPRWILQRERGGVEIAAGVGPLEEVARSLQIGDGIVVPPDMTMEDLYFTLADVRAGQLGLVGCQRVPDKTWATLERDPLLAVGHCGSFPIGLRVTGFLRDPRVLIALRDGYVDDAGDVIPLAELRDVDGHDVLLRAQVDATAADLAATLHSLRNAHEVYLAWGVNLDGDDVPVGVRPGLRVLTAPPPTPSPDGQSPDPAAVPTERAAPGAR